MGPTSHRPRVCVAMSGGVDSSVAAALLVEQGYEVIGVMLRLWSEPMRPAPDAAAFTATTNRCCSVESVHDARAVADRLDIPFYVINAEQQFKEDVVDLFVREYAAGRTPNPCLACNRRIRFGFLMDYTRSLGAHHLATGHYARVRRATDGCFQLWRGADRAKDQSYVLSVLGQADLAAVLFPVGEYTKAEVRALAAERGLPTASRAESQDLCFVSDGDYRRFLTVWAPESARPGPIFDRQGDRVGTHRGLPFYTIGQRSGLGVTAPQPMYVLEMDAGRNALIVGTAQDLGNDCLTTGHVNWIAGAPPQGAPPQGALPQGPLRQGAIRAEVQIRYHAAPTPATVLPRPDGRSDVRFAAPVRDITPGQAAVFYDGEMCLGGGIIEMAGRAA